MTICNQSQWIVTFSSFFSTAFGRGTRAFTATTMRPHRGSRSSLRRQRHASIFPGPHIEEHGVVSTKTKLEPGASVFEGLRDRGYETGVFSENTWITQVDVGLKDGFDTIVGPQNAVFPDAVHPKEFVASEGQGQYATYLKESMRSDNTVKSLINGLATKVVWDYPNLAPDFLKARTPASVYADRFLDWESDTSGPWAACLNLMDAHIPYDPAAEHDRWGSEKARSIQNEFEDHKWEFNAGTRPWWELKAIEGLYDGGIRQADEQVGRILSELRSREELDDTLVVISADHGEGFGEPSNVRPDTRVAEHGVGIHEALFHVPLVVKYPGQRRKRTVESAASLTRFPAVVDDVLEGDHDIGSEFVPDGPVLTTAVGLDGLLRERAERYCDDLSPYTSVAKAVYEDEGEAVNKYVTWRSEAATVKVWDARTVRKVASSDYGRVEAAFEGIDTAGSAAVTEGSLGDDTQRQLEDLGYI